MSNKYYLLAAIYYGQDWSWGKFFKKSINVGQVCACKFDGSKRKTSKNKYILLLTIHSVKDWKQKISVGLVRDLPQFLHIHGFIWVLFRLPLILRLEKKLRSITWPDCVSNQRQIKGCFSCGWNWRKRCAAVEKKEIRKLFRGKNDSFHLFT